ADRNRSHWSTSKTPSYTKSVSWQHHREGDTFSVTAFDIHDETNAIIGNVGQGGQAFVRGIQQQGTIKITWLEASMPKTCIAQYQQPNVTSEKIQQTIILNNILCQLQ
ncbi:FimD/PapC C-terminal domain-containing protein, partial [Escherichia coli]|uniref:FimD/PapC C-terminal domain-containing protein n=1 Tax=Escherichia coli TaxID=562 RepID=UPI000B1221A4